MEGRIFSDYIKTRNTEYGDRLTRIISKINRCPSIRPITRNISIALCNVFRSLGPPKLLRDFISNKYVHSSNLEEQSLNLKKFIDIGMALTMEDIENLTLLQIGDQCGIANFDGIMDNLSEPDRTCLTNSIETYNSDFLNMVQYSKLDTEGRNSFEYQHILVETEEQQSDIQTFTFRNLFDVHYAFYKKFIDEYIRTYIDLFPDPVIKRIVSDRIEEVLDVAGYSRYTRHTFAGQGEFYKNCYFNFMLNTFGFYINNEGVNQFPINIELSLIIWNPNVEIMCVYNSAEILFTYIHELGHKIVQFEHPVDIVINSINIKLMFTTKKQDWEAENQKRIDLVADYLASIKFIQLKKQYGQDKYSIACEYLQMMKYMNGDELHYNPDIRCLYNILINDELLELFLSIEN